jgi:hypothetical protein
MQRLDMMLHRLLPFAVVLIFLIASVTVGFASPAAGAAGLIATMAGVVTTYLHGRGPR